MDAIGDMSNGSQSRPYIITIYEDDEAAAQLVSNGTSTSDRGRHIHVGSSFVGQFVENGQVKIVHCPTKRMTADALTKPLGPSQLLRLRDYLLGYKILEKGCVMGNSK